MLQCKIEIMSNEVKTVATNFGFMPVLEGKRYFISYKSEDSERVGEITRILNEMGVPMWYDYGIEKGERWTSEINRNIEECEAFILFASKVLFSVEDTWVRKEFRLANMSQKKKYVVWLDDINPYKNPKDVHSKLKDWFVDVDDLQGIKMAGKTVDQIAWSMVTEFHLIQGNKPQPPSPRYLPSVSKTARIKETKVKHDSIPVSNSTQEYDTVPASNTNHLYAIDVFGNSIDLNDGGIPIIRSKPIEERIVQIIIIAVVIGVATLGGIWAVSHIKSNLSSDSSRKTDDFTNDSISSSLSSSTQDVKPLSELGTVSVGEHFTFGNYKQGKNGEVQPIEWRVLDVQDSKALIISEKLLDYMQYNETEINVTWETCTLRKWMNNDLINEIFTYDEQQKIVTVTNINPDNSQYGTNGGNNTQDKLFLLNSDEAENYFLSNKDRIAYTNDYGCIYGQEDHSYIWWLRSPGLDSQRTAYVEHTGEIGGYINLEGLNIDYDKVGIRPALWINL